MWHSQVKDVYGVAPVATGTACRTPVSRLWSESIRLEGPLSAYRGLGILTKQSGFTLLEMLVSMVVFAIAMALMSGALLQSTKMLDRIERGNDRFIQDWRSMRALQEAVANMRALKPTRGASTLETRPPPEGLKGTTTQLSVWTVRHPLAEAGRVTKLEADLAPITGTDQVRLSVGAPPTVASRFAASAPQGSISGTAVVAVLQGGAQWRYQDIAGGWHTQWPAGGRERELLPRAVALVAVEGWRSGTRTQLLAVWPFSGQVIESELRDNSFLDVVEAMR